MKRAFAVIGANFGDEGKGLMTDFFCRKNSDVINIRSNGGSQAGHTVVTEKGRHIFSHIGAGTFSGADTYLSEYFIVNPIMFMREYLDLKKNFNISAKVIVSENAVISIPCDMLLNQFSEKSRGENRHGSCGLGIYETILRNCEDNFKIRFKDISKSDSLRRFLFEKISYINKIYVPKRLENLGISNMPDEFYELLSSDILTENFLDDLLNMKKICLTSDNSILDKYENAVFESAQGLLLDCERKEYFPHLTPSHTGMKNIRSILKNFSVSETEICYVTRSYFTRHGAGKFNTECQDIAVNYKLNDKTNSTNEYQGNFRYGFFDIQEFEKSIRLESRYILPSDKLSLCVTHLDETKDRIICKNENISPELVSNLINAKLYKSYGETAEDIK